MANITLHGAAPYSRLDGEECQNMTESKYLGLVLGPQRQDDQVGGGVGEIFVIIYLYIWSFLPHTSRSDETFLS